MSLNPPSRLLVRGVNWLGDAVMTTPALLRLREALPGTHITLLTRAKLADLWKAHPAINQMIQIQHGESVWTLGRRLRALDFDTALVLPNSPRTALEVWWARIPRRIGYARPWRNWFLTDIVQSRPGYVRMAKPTARQIRYLVETPQAVTRKRPPKESHQTYDYLHLAGSLGAKTELLAPRLAMTPAEVEAAQATFQLSAKAVWLGLNAGAEYGPAKRWPVDRFIATAQMVRQHVKCGVMVFGGVGDTEIAQAIMSQLNNDQLPVINLAGRTSLRELMAAMIQCRALLTNDTGPMHLAAALGVPVVVPFGSTSPELTGPGLPDDSRNRLLVSNALCSPCFLRECPIDFRCMHEISVDQATAAVLELMSVS